MTNITISRAAKRLILASATLGLSACMVPGGAYGDGYVNGGANGYACDPYDPYDEYYSCDSGYGFANIGFGGGWYDNYFYPGYGLFVFDRGGHRHQMKNHHRRFWAHRRHQHGAKYGRRGGRHHANRGRNLSPEQRAERRERRVERRERRRDNGAVRGGSAVSQQDLQYRNREARREARRGKRQANGQRSGNRNSVGSSRRGRPTMAQQQPQRARPVARQQSQRRAQPAPRRAPVARAPSERSSTVRSTRHSPATSRRNVSDQ